MQGFFKAAVHDASGLGNTPEEMDRPYLEAIKEGRLQEFLGTLPLVQKSEVPNKVFQTLSQFLLANTFGVTTGWANLIGGTTGLACIELNTIATEPTYTEVVGHSGTDQASIHDTESINATYTLWKHLFAHSSEPFRVWSDPDGREGYYWRDRFLWLPSNGLFSNIRGARAQLNSNSDDTANNYLYRAWASRTRFKNSGGTPITMEKTASQSFLIEYLLKLFTR